MNIHGVGVHELRFTVNSNQWLKWFTTISGQTQDCNGSPVAGCIVKLYATATDTLMMSTISDANGVFSFLIPSTLQYYIVAYKAGGSDLAGTTVNTLMGT